MPMDVDVTSWPGGAPDANGLDVDVTRLPAYHAVAYEALTVDATVGGVALASASVALAGAGGKVVGVLATAQIRFRTDGGAPTTAAGIPLEAGQQLTIDGATDMAAFRAIRTTGTSGVLHLQYFAVN